MSAQHTPGPWEVVVSTFGGRLCMAGNANIADVWEGLADIKANEADANARLIAAAPDLLDALQALRARWLGLDVVTEPEMDDDDALEARVNAAIAKATGEAA